MAQKLLRTSVNLDDLSLEILDAYAKKNAESKRSVALRLLLREFSEG